MIKIGRRGSLSGTLTVHGVQGHAAYPHLADNPVRGIVALLDALLHPPLDEGTDDFQPTNLEVTTIDVGNPAANVIPGTATAQLQRPLQRHAGRPRRCRRKSTTGSTARRAHAAAARPRRPVDFELDLDATGRALSS